MHAHVPCSKFGYYLLQIRKTETRRTLLLPPILSFTLCPGSYLSPLRRLLLSVSPRLHLPLCLGGAAMASKAAASTLSLLRTLVASSTRTLSTSSPPFAASASARGAAYFPGVTRFCSSSARGDGGLATRNDGREVDGDEKRRRVLNRILYRSRQRGYLELDLLLGKWTEENIASLDEKRLQELVELLEGENPDLWNWFTGQAEVPSNLAENSVFAAIKNQISENLTTYSSPRTRAQPGKPWVRGWDDNRKVGGPQAGNQ